MRKGVILGLVSTLAVACSADPSGPHAHGAGSGGDETTTGGSGHGGPEGIAPPAPSATGTGGPVTPPTTLHTSGGKIVDANGQTVRLTGVSWFGLETETFAPHGLHVRKLGDMLDQIKSVGFNVVRVPFSNQLFSLGATPNGIDFTKNPDLAKLSGLQILDAVVAGAKARGLKILLDRHRPTAAGQSALWYTPEVSEQQWIDDWKMLATRYANEPTVIGADLHNEPHGEATWGDGNAQTDWRLAAQKAGNAIVAVNPRWLIVVEGVEVYANQYYWWGGNLRGAAAAPVTLTVPDRVVYSPHDYPASVYAQPWFSAPGYPANLPGVWSDTWGRLATDGTAPVLLGEFGSKLATQTDKQWLGALVDYLRVNGMSFTFWSWNPDSGDTGGILADDWTTLLDEKVAAIKPALAPPIP